MLALTYHRSVPAFALVRASGGNPEVATSALSMLHLGDVPEPELPAAGWMRVMPTLSGICGSDLAAIGGHAFLFPPSPDVDSFVPGAGGGCAVRGREPKRDSARRCVGGGGVATVRLPLVGGPPGP